MPVWEPKSTPEPAQKIVEKQPIEAIETAFTPPSVNNAQPRQPIAQTATPTVAPTAPMPIAAAPIAPIVAQIQPAPQVQTVVLKTFGRPPKPEAVGRDKFTTRLKTELVVELKTRAAKRKITVADLIEMIVGENYERY
jgi:hypothetical protein